MSYCFLILVISLIYYFVGDCSYPEHGLPTPRISNPAEGCEEATTLCLVGVFEQKGPECFLNGGKVKVKALREAIERAVRAEAERDAARHEVAIGRLEIDAASSSQAQVEFELARV